MVGLVFHEVFERAHPCPCKQRSRGIGASPLTKTQESSLLDYIQPPGQDAIAQFKPQIADGLIQIANGLVWGEMQTTGTSDVAHFVLGNPPTQGQTGNGEGFFEQNLQNGWVLLLRKDAPGAGANAQMAGIFTNDAATLHQYAGPDGEFAIVAPLTQIVPAQSKKPASTNAGMIALGIAGVLGLAGIIWAVVSPAGGAHPALAA